MERHAVNVLLIGENENAWWNFAGRLEQMGCQWQFASTAAEVRALTDRRLFRFVLSARPVTERSPVMRLAGPDCNVFYSIPVEHSCLWLQALPETTPGPRVSALRPRQFMTVLSDLIAEAAKGLARGRPKQVERGRGPSEGLASNVAIAEALAAQAGQLPS
jgi:hypothetical protein